MRFSVPQFFEIIHQVDYMLLVALSSRWWEPLNTRFAACNTNFAAYCNKKTGTTDFAKSSYIDRHIHIYNVVS